MILMISNMIDISKSTSTAEAVAPLVIATSSSY